MIRILLLILTLLFQQQSDAVSKFNRGVELQKQGSHEAAAAEYRAALAIKPEYPEALANLGVVLAQMGRYDEAIEAYRAALGLAPNLKQILMNLGIVHFRAGDFEKAAEQLSLYLEWQPSSVQATLLIGISMVELGKDEEAIKQLESVLQATKNDTAALYSLGLAYLRLDRPELKWAIEQLSVTESGKPASHLLKGQALIAGREYESAISELQTAVTLNAEMPKLQYSLGLAFQQLGRNKDALLAFQNEYKGSPNDLATIYYLAYLNEAEGNLPEADKLVATVLKRDPQSPEANALNAKILFKQDKADEALKPLEFAVSKKPNDHEMRYLLARIYQKLGRKEDAAREFAEVQRLKSEALRQDRAKTQRPQRD